MSKGSVIMLDYSYRKFIKYIKKCNNGVRIVDLENKFKITDSEARKIMNALFEENLVASKSYYFVPTTKCKMYFINESYDFLKSNLIAILALIVSITALIRTF